MKLFFRRISRDKKSFLINLVGLSTGFICAILILVWCNNELNVGRFHVKNNRLYQVMINNYSSNNVETREFTQGILADALKNEIPEVEFAVASAKPWISPKSILSNETDKIIVHDQYVGKKFFNLFSFELIQGDKDNVLTDKYAVVVSEESALKLFGTSQNIIGKTVKCDRYPGSDLFTITGVFKTPPVNSLQNFDVLFSYEFYLEKNPQLQNWSNSGPKTYVLLKEGTEKVAFNVKIANFLKQKDEKTKDILFIRSYANKYLYDNYENGVLTGGRITYVKILYVLVMLILFIACINCINLSIAKASERFKEIGIKKVLGADRKIMILKDLGESFFLTGLSLLLSTVVVFLLLPRFNLIIGKQLSIPLDIRFVFTLLCIVLIIGLLSGFFPAFYLSKLKPVHILKGRIRTSAKKQWIGKGLVVFQFMISTSLIMYILAIHEQTNFITSKDLGLKKENLIIFDNGSSDSKTNEALNNESRFKQNMETFLQMIRNAPGVISATNFWHNIPEQHGSTSNISWQGKAPENKIKFACLIAGYDYIETLDIKMKSGRTFSRDFGNDKNNIIINEYASKIMELKEPIGSIISIGGEEKHIIGIAKDFNFQSLYDNIKPLYVSLDISPMSSKIMVRLQSESEKATIGQIKNIYEEYNNGYPFEYKYLDDQFKEVYKSDFQMVSILNFFAVIAILISCLGLFGITTLSIKRRAKEVAIRKVHGSRAIEIVKFLSLDFTKLVVISIILAIPLSFFIIKSWLNKFAYRVDIEIWIFILSGIIIVGLAWFTVSLEVFRTANLNPSIVLKDE